MAEKKEILLEVKTSVAKSIQEIAELNHKIADLRAEEHKLGTQMENLAKKGEENSDVYRTLEQQLAANKEQQKALRKEVAEHSRSVQNLMVAEKSQVETLKGKAALLAAEKDKLRQIKIVNGELSDEYRKQQKKVADLNNEVLELEKAYGVHTRNVGNYESAWSGMLGKLKIGWAALIALVIKGLKEFTEDFIKMTQRTSDAWNAEVAGWKSAYQQFIISLQRGDGWRELIANMQDAYATGKLVAQMLDEIFERENSLRLEEAQMAAENEQLKIDMRDRTKTDEERIAAAQKLLENEQSLAKTRQEIADQERDARALELEQYADLTEEERKYYIQQYNEHRDIIKEAIAYNNEIDTRKRLIADLEAQQTASTAGAGGFNMNSTAARVANGGVSISDQINATQAEIDALQAQASEGLKGVAAIAAKYNMLSDEAITNYVEAEIKAQTVQSEMTQRTARAQNMMHSLQAELKTDNDRAAEQAKQKRDKDAEEERKAEEKRLKEQISAYKQYWGTVAAMYTELAAAEMNESEKQVAAVKGRYKEQEKTIREYVQSGAMSYEEGRYLLVKLAQKTTEEIKKIEDDARDEEKRAQQAALAEQAQARKDQLTTDLQIAWQNADEQFRIKKEYLENEIDIYKDDATKKAELEQQLTELIRSEQERRTEIVMDYVSQLEQAFGYINEIANNYSKERIQNAEAQNTAEKNALEKRLKAGLISQKQYDDKVAKMDADLADKKAEETRKQAQRDKALAIFQAAINTASAIVKVWTDVPTMLAPAFTAVVAAVGALQTAAIMSQPLPKAAKGGKVEGASHERGGVLIEAEGDERIIAANPAKAFPELLNLISYIGKHGGAPQTGYDIRNSAPAEAIDYVKIEAAMTAAVEKIRVWLSLTELRNAEQQQVQIEELARQ